MSDIEALMWAVEKDPYLDPTFGSVTLLDRPPDLDRLRRRLLRMVHRIPRLHQRVVPSFGRLAPPEWHDDVDFDIDHHLRRIVLPAPGTVRQLYDLAATIVHDPLDRTRPLWEFTVVGGVEGGEPRSSRRCTTPSPTVRAGSACPSSSSTRPARHPTSTRW